MALFPKADSAYEVSRQYLTQKIENPALLAAFEESLRSLWFAPAQIRREVQEHAQRMHDAGKVSLEVLPQLRAQLEEPALKYYANTLEQLDKRFTDDRAEGEYAERLKKLRAAVAYARERKE